MSEERFYRSYGSRWRQNGTVHRLVSRRGSAASGLLCGRRDERMPYGRVVTLAEVRNALDREDPPPFLCAQCPGIRGAVYDA